jgi:hypothetical protein
METINNLLNYRNDDHPADIIVLLHTNTHPAVHTATDIVRPRPEHATFTILLQYTHNICTPTHIHAYFPPYLVLFHITDIIFITYFYI